MPRLILIREASRLAILVAERSTIPRGKPQAERSRQRLGPKRGIDPTMTIAGEEVFGPVAVVIPVAPSRGARIALHC